MAIDVNKFVQNATQEGYSSDEIYGYLQKKGLVPTSVTAGTGGTATTPSQPTPQPSPTPTPMQDQSQQLNQPMPAPSPQPKNLVQKVADAATDWLPAIGAVGGAVVGTPFDLLTGPAGTAVGAGLGAAGGEALKEQLKGEHASLPKIATQGVVGGATEGIGGALMRGAGAVAKAVGPSVSETAANIAGKVSPAIFNTVAKADPYFASSVNKLTQVAQKYGLMDITVPQAVQKLPSIMKDLGTKVAEAISENNNSVPLKSALDNLQGAIQKGTNYLTGEPAWNSAKQYVENRLASIESGGQPVTPILDATGKPFQTAADTTIGKLYDLKSELSGELAPTFKKMASGNYNLLPKEEMNLALWNSLKDTIDQYGSTAIKTLNDDQHAMYDVAKGLVTGYKKGASGAPVGLRNIFELLAPGGPAVALADIGANTAAGKRAVSGALGAVGNALTNGSIPAGVKNALRLGTQGVTQNAADKSMPAIGGGASQGTDQNANSQAEDIHTYSLPKGVVIDKSGNVALPPLEPHTVATGYSKDQYMKDLASHATVDAFRNTDKARRDAAVQVAQSKIDAQKLGPDEEDLLNKAGKMNEVMNQLRQQIKETPPSVFNRSKDLDALAQYNNGQYAQMVANMKTLRGILGQSIQGGVLRGFDLSNFNIGPDQGDSPSTALAKLNQAHKQLVDNYMRYLPRYGLSLD